MGEEAVFYGDVLGFRARVKGKGDRAVDALSDLAEMLSGGSLAKYTGQDRWEHRYALSDSVFLTHSDPGAALRAAADLMFNLAYLNHKEDDATLLRAGIGYGGVRHIKGIFLDTGQKPANLVGEGVLEAIDVAEESGLKGPRLLVSENVVDRVRKRDGDLCNRLIIPTEVHQVWEILWLLPAEAEELNTIVMRGVGDMAVRFLRRWGGHPNYGTHYREFVILVLRSEAQLTQWPRDVRRRGGEVALVDREEVRAALHSTSGLPEDFKLRVASILGRL